jgi:Tfp pilus assembly protein PilF
MSDTPLPPKVCTLDGFIRQFLEQHRQRPDQSFCFILGAGASRDSGIPTGREMAGKWLELYHENHNHDDLPVDRWLGAGHLPIKDFDPKNPAPHYSQLYELLYRDKDQAGFSYLESVMEGKEPSYGYSVLSYLLSGTHHRIVITTNFDNLITDALAIHASTFPIVVNEDSLVHYVRANVHRPLVAKIHGSLGFKPKSRSGDLKLDDPWKKALAAIFQTHTPVVIGYDGNDGSLMKLLEESAPGAPEFLWWCYHCPTGVNPHQRAAEQPERVRQLVASRSAEFVPIPGFDLFMLRLLTRMKKEFPDKIPDLFLQLRDKTTARLERYKSQQDELGGKLPATATKESDSTASTTPTVQDQDLQEEAALLAKSAQTKPWWMWQTEINAQVDPAAKDALYREAIRHLPDSAKLLGNYALFLKNIIKDYDAADACYKRAIEKDRDDAIILGNYAVFLETVRKDHGAAGAIYERAIKANPENFTFLGNYAVFLESVRKDYPEAEIYYGRAIEANSKDPVNLGAFASFLSKIRKNQDAAERLYKRAIEADLENASNLGNYANFLTEVRGDHAAAESYYQRALKADPKHADHLGNHANFLTGIRKDHAAAQRLYESAIEIAPDNVTVLCNYATFLNGIRRDYEAAERYYKRAIEVDPEHVNNLCNYSQFLLGRGHFIGAIEMLRKAWKCRNGADMLMNAELSYSLWLGSKLTRTDGRVWEAVYKFSLARGFHRAVWNFDGMLEQARNVLRNTDFMYARALAAAYLDESKVPALNLYAHWKELKPIDPRRVNPYGFTNTS